MLQTFCQLCMQGSFLVVLRDLTTDGARDGTGASYMQNFSQPFLAFSYFFFLLYHHSVQE